MNDQIALFEPTGPEVGKLAAMHAAKSEKAMAAGDVFASRGWEALAKQSYDEGRHHFEEACALAMLAEFERLGGVKS
jgi:hypothetical protein